MATNAFYIDAKPIMDFLDDSPIYQRLDDSRHCVGASIVGASTLLSWLFLTPARLYTHHAGNNFLEETFSSSADLLHIRSSSIFVQSANPFMIVELYHQPILQAFSIIQIEAWSIGDYFALQITGKEINASLAADRLIPTLLP